ncbi:MAG: hypothetical protein J6M59_12555 [Bacteroidaceae bacterium]|nr:hypothetical protein [Bacteroidaceae bacterium]
MYLPNIWNNILDWFQDLSERNALVREFNTRAKESFVSGIMPTMLKCSISRGCKEYKHQFSAWFYTGFRIQALAGRALSRDEIEAIGKVVLSDTNLVRRLVALGWDTLEIHSDNGRYGLRWKLIDYTNINYLLK